MKSARFLSSAAALLFALGVLLPARADEAPAALTEVHQILLQAVGPDADHPPTQQKELVEQAIERLHHVPHIYHGQLKRAEQDLEAALDELSTGDTAHKVRGDIFDADDLIKSLMD